MIWYKHYPEAFIEGTTELSLEEIGAYALVLNLIYSRNGNVSNDDAFLCRALRCSTRVWRRIKKRLIEVGKLSVEDGRIVNPRASLEIVSAKLRANFGETLPKNPTKSTKMPKKRGDILDTREVSKKEEDPGTGKILPFSKDPLPDPKQGAIEESKPATGEPSPPEGRGPPSPVYAFEQGVIRLKEGDLAKWMRAYPHLSVEGELIGLAVWAAKQDNWFCAVSGALAKKERQAMIEIAKNVDKPITWQDRLGYS